MNASHDVFAADSPEIYRIQTHGPGPAGRLPLTDAMLAESPSGDLSA